MDDLIDDGGPDGPDGPGNAPEFSVSELSGAVKRTVEGAFSHVRVRGEIGRLSRPRSGHVYLDLKDDRSVLASVIWKGVAARLTHMPEEGMEVVATGRLTTFPGQSKYQLVIEDLRPAGAGALMAMLEKRRAMLAAEGLFDADRKAPLPFLPEVIGVVTSPSGAVIRDILHRLRDRFPRRVLIWPVAVQGERCAPEVARAIAGFNALTPGGALPRPDLLIVARGGGSLEDLWGFNDEAVVRATAASGIPLISAVGHETDTTLIDHASDWRAPTPTAAAEKAVPVRLDLMNWLQQQEALLTRTVTQDLAARGQRLRDLGRSLPRADALLDAARQRLDLAAAGLVPALRQAAQKARSRADTASAQLIPALDRNTAAKRMRAGQASASLRPAILQRTIRDERARLTREMARLSLDRQTTRLTEARTRLSELATQADRTALQALTTRRDRLETLSRLHQTLGYTETLRRGYAVVHGATHPVKSRAEAATQNVLEIEFADGRLPVTPTTARVASASAPQKPKPKPKDDQGSLF